MWPFLGRVVVFIFSAITCICRGNLAKVGRYVMGTLRYTVFAYRVCARRPCWRSKTIKLFSFGKKFNCHAKIILLFTPPTWPPRTDSILRLRVDEHVYHVVMQKAIVVISQL